MLAVVITRPGGPEVLELREVPQPVPGPGEILVRVAAVGLNRADILQRKGHYPAPAGSPADIPGLEYAGEVAALGPSAAMPRGTKDVAAGASVAASAPRWRVGDRVMGLVGGGAYAEFLVTHADMAIPVPAAWPGAEAGRDPLVLAGAVPEVFLTAYDALVLQLGMKAGETVLVHAVASGVGTAALQLVKAWDARCIGTSRSAAKLERARALGLDVAIDSSREDFAEAVRRETGGRGVDVVLDLVGGPFLEGNLKALAPRGRMVIVGLTAGRTAPIDLGVVLNKRLTLVGTAMRSRALEEKVAVARAFERGVLPLFASGRLRPVLDRTFPMAQVAEAHRVMEADASFGKLVLVW
jgi:putative PIG3 family NAD(P)H quinone oxidoreductase